MVHFHQSSKDLVYFDIRLKSHGLKNTVLIRGNDSEVSNIPIEGHVKLLTQEDLHVKRIRLELVGEFLVDYYGRTESGHASGQVYERNCVLKVVWANLLTSSEGSVLYGDYGDSMIKMHKVESYLRKSLRDSSTLDLSAAGSPFGSLTDLAKKRPTFSRAASLSALFKSPEESLFQIPRSGVDGTPYPLLRGSDHHSFLLPQGNYSMPFLVNLLANVPESVEGLPTGKVLYKLFCVVERGRFDRCFQTASHIRLVRTLHPRNMNLTDSIEFTSTWPGKLEFCVSTPRKALAMGTSIPVKLIIVPLVKGLSFKSMSVTIVQHNHVRGLTGSSPEFEIVASKQKLDCSDSEFGEDGWVVRGNYDVPSSLLDVTQTCTLKNDMINVKHRLRVGIHIRNADGHVSELKANLPVYIFMSPSHGRVTTRHLEVDLAHGIFTSEVDPSRQDVIFDHADEESANNSSQEDGDGEFEDETKESAPPLYQQHVYDTVFDYNSPKTPLEQLRSHGIPPNIGGYFDIPRAGSKSGTATPMDLEVLLKVPSYDQALDEQSDEGEDEPAPLYPMGNNLDALSEYVTNRLKDNSPVPVLTHARLGTSKLTGRIRFLRK